MCLLKDLRETLTAINTSEHQKAWIKKSVSETSAGAVSQTTWQ